MHRSYQSVLPCHSQLLQKRWDKTYYDEHRKKVREAAPMVDTRAPVTYMHMHMKLKKLQLEEERLATIERDNRILLEKMSCIMRTKGRVDNFNNYDYKSLNLEKRQRELLRVTRENQAILKRIMMREADYSQEKWQKDWAENQHFMENISHYPPAWWLLREEDIRTSRKQKKGGKDSAEKKSARKKSGRKSRKQTQEADDDEESAKGDGQDHVEDTEAKHAKGGRAGDDIDERKDSPRTTKDNAEEGETVDEQ